MHRFLSDMGYKGSMRKPGGLSSGGVSPSLMFQKLWGALLDAAEDAAPAAGSGKVTLTLSLTLVLALKNPALRLTPSPHPHPRRWWCAPLCRWTCR